MNLQNDNLYKKVEGMLYSYPKTKAEIENIKLDIEELNDIMGIKGTSDSPKGSTPTYQFNSNVENEVIDREENLPERISSMNRLLRSKERFLKKVENSINTLGEDDRKLIEMKYFKKSRLECIAEVFGMSVDGIVKRRKTIILELIDLF